MNITYSFYYHQKGNKIIAMTKIPVFRELKNIEILKTPRDLYLFLDYMASNNPPEVRRFATFKLSSLLGGLKKHNKLLYHLLCEILLYELVAGTGKEDTWLQRNILEVLIPVADSKILNRICDFLKEGNISQYNIQRLARIGLNCE